MENNVDIEIHYWFHSEEQTVRGNSEGKKEEMEGRGKRRQLETKSKGKIKVKAKVKIEERKEGSQKSGGKIQGKEGMWTK